MWLNDEVINLYMTMIQDRSHKCYAFNSFFITCLSNGKNKLYDYNKVQKWTRGKYVLEHYEKIFFPVNINNAHWALIVIHVIQQEIHYYDSNYTSTGKIFLDFIFKWLADEVKDKKLSINTSKDEWLLLDDKDLTNVPKQDNSYDCGVFTLVAADFISQNKPLSYSQKEMTEYRKKILTEILKLA